MEIQKEKPEFNETIKLVEAVLERLTFHAFEEVLIWSNEHASRALNLCLKKTLKEFESGDLIQTSGYPTLKHFSVDSVVKALSTALDQAQDYQCNLNKEIDRLENQLSKAQVPEGFVLVPRLSANYLFNKVPELGFKHPDEKDTVLYHLNYMASEFKESARQFVESDHTKQKAFIKAQEQGHETSF